MGTRAVPRAGGGPAGEAGRVRRRRWRGRLLVLAGALALILPAATQASAQSYIELNETSFNRPSMTWAVGSLLVAWAGTDTNGEVNVAKFAADPTSAEQAKWTLQDSSTYTGATVSIGYSHSSGNAVVAWTNGQGQVYAATVGAGGTDGFGCVTELGVSKFSPYVTSEGDDGSGNMYVTFANTSDQMAVDQLDFSSCNASAGTGPILVDHQTVITSDTTSGGPALAVSGYGGTERFWMVWASTGTTPTINIAQWVPNSETLTGKTTETSHTTTADIAAAYNTADGKVFDTYCGTNNEAYYQYFTPGSSGISGLTQSSLNDTCSLVKSNGYVSGGVGTAYDYNAGFQEAWQAWTGEGCTIASPGNCNIFLSPIPNP